MLSDIFFKSILWKHAFPNINNKKKETTFLKVKKRRSSNPGLAFLAWSLKQALLLLYLIFMTLKKAK